MSAPENLNRRNDFREVPVARAKFARSLETISIHAGRPRLKLEKAHDLIEKAVRLEPKSPGLSGQPGVVLYKLNRPQEALPQLQKAIELSEETDRRCTIIWAIFMPRSSKPTRRARRE